MRQGKGSMTMRVLILGAGGSVSDTETTPAWLAESSGEILIERFVKACTGLAAKLIFAVRANDMRRYRIDSVIALAAPGSAVVPIAGETQGAACTALLCIKHLDPNDELLILNSNEFLDIDYKTAIEGFRRQNHDAAVVTFHSIHPRYSYVQLDDAGLIIEAAEKHPISRHATAGFYWFSRGADFIAASQDMIRKDAHLDGKFFISLVFNELVLKQKRLGTLEVDSRHYFPLKSRRQVSVYEADIHSDEAA
jgi:hypothetical protein